MIIFRLIAAQRKYNKKNDFFCQEIDTSEAAYGFRREFPWKELIFTGEKGGLRIKGQRKTHNADGRTYAEYDVS